jgi:hypothetical protein
LHETDAGGEQVPLVQCEDCKRPISRRARTCPHCGAPRESPFAAIAGIVLALGILGGLGWFVYEDQKRPRIAQLPASKPNAEADKKRAVAAAPKPAPKKAPTEGAQRATLGAKALKKSIANADASRLTSVLVVEGTGAVCYEYETANAFGGKSPGKAVLVPDSDKVLSSEMTGFARAWSQECDRKAGTQVASGINWFAL